MPEKLAAIVRAYELRSSEVFYHDDFFDKRTKDIHWLREVSLMVPKPFVVSGDTRILERPDEAQTLRECDLTFFCLASGWTNIPFEIQAWRFIKAWQNIVAAVQRIQQPTIFTVECGKRMNIEPLEFTRKFRGH